MSNDNVNIGDRAIIVTRHSGANPGEIIGKVKHHVLFRPDQQQGEYGKGNDPLSEKLRAEFCVDEKHLGCRFGFYTLERKWPTANLQTKGGDWMPPTSIVRKKGPDINKDRV